MVGWVSTVSPAQDEDGVLAIKLNMTVIRNHISYMSHSIYYMMHYGFHV